VSNCAVGDLDRGHKLHLEEKFDIDRTELYPEPFLAGPSAYPFCSFFVGTALVAVEPKEITLAIL
jgi:hypothetical protein